MVRSRLRRYREGKAKKLLMLNFLGIVGIIILLIFFGIPLITHLSLLVEKKFDASTKQKNATDNFVPPPQLDNTFSATGSASINISGTGQKNLTILLYVNDEQVSEEEVIEDGTFLFENIKLNDGGNTIFAKAKSDTKTSDASNKILITYINKPPSLSIDNPGDGQTFSKDEKTIIVSGKTDSDTNTKVTVNGFWAIMGADGKFSYRINLQDGDNHIKIEATNGAGNKETKEITVKYSP
jgi:hypothetical protein